MKRRRLLMTGAGAAGALVVGWGVLPPRSRLGHSGSLPKAAADWVLNGWIRIAIDQQISLVMPRSEMGQGVHTALAMMVAEELDVPLEMVRLVEAGPDRLYANVAAALSLLAPDDAIDPSARDGTPTKADADASAESGDDEPPFDTRRWFVAKIASQLGIDITGGSSSTTDGWSVVRLAAATARAQLLGAASLSWRLPVSELGVGRGVISHPSGPRATYGMLARQASATPPGDVRLKNRSQWTLLGTPAKRLDGLAQSNGSAVFGMDVRPPGLVFASMRHGPMLGSSPGQVGVEAAMRLPGVQRVVHLGSVGGSTAGVAVVGRTSWHALQGARALDIAWMPPPGPRLQSASIEAELARLALQAHASGEGNVARSQGTAPAAAGARHLSARYGAPYLAHAAMEPVNCTARVADGTVEIWAPTQVPTFARATAAQVAGVDVSKVTLHVPCLGGSFGRRLEVDHVGQAVRVAMETGGRPVQLLWTREDDLRHDFYRPAAAATLSATLGDDGLPISLVATTACDATLPRWIERVMPERATRLEWPGRNGSEGLADLPYAIAHQRIVHLETHSGVPIGFWRSSGHSHNAFFAESFIDELAALAGLDPLAYRLRMLEHASRQAAVLRLAGDRAGWARPLPAGRARGVALHGSFGSVVAQVVEVSKAPGPRGFRIDRLVCAADVGTVVNPTLVAQQMEGAIVFALTAALHGRIDIVDGAVVQSNFRDHPLLRMNEAPRIDVHLVPSRRPPAGAGEPGVPPTAPALANALFALTGQRLRSLPLRLST